MSPAVYGVAGQEDFGRDIDTVHRAVPSRGREDTQVS